MQISDFNSILELAATINIAFVAVEYTKNYTSILSNNVFKFPELITQAFKDCNNSLCNIESLKHIDPIEIGGKSTLPQIEKTKVMYEELSKKITEEEERLNNKISKSCEAKSFSALSFWMFMYSTLLLLIAGVGSEYGSSLILSGYVFGIITTLYLIAGWLWGESKPCICAFLNYSLLRHTIIWFITCYSIAIITGATLEGIFNPSVEYLNKLSNKLSLIMVTIPFVNFIAYFYIIKRKVKTLKKEINDAIEPIKKSCDEFKRAVDKLIAIKDMDTILMSD